MVKDNNHRKSKMKKIMMLFVLVFTASGLFAQNNRLKFTDMEGVTSVLFQKHAVANA